MEKENDIQNTICEYLKLKNHFFWRQNTSPTMQFGNGSATFRRMGKYALKGVPDIFVVHNGKVYLIEVKRPKGKLSEHQLEFQRRCAEENVPYYVVYSVDDVMKIL